MKIQMSHAWEWLRNKRKDLTITENGFFGFLWILFLFGYCYQSVNVITFRLAQSDHIKRRLLYLCKMVKIATRTKWIIRKIVKDVNCLFISENFPKFALWKGRGMGGVTSARNERHTVLPKIQKKERRKGDGGWL